MTDNEIINALKSCGDENNCPDCPFKDERFGYDVTCAEELMKSAAELIEKQKKKIHLLKQHPPITINMDEKLKEAYKNAKVEAYKEFANKLYEGENYGWLDWETKELVYSNEDIQNLLAELTHHKETTVSLIDGHIEGSDD